MSRRGAGVIAMKYNSLRGVTYGSRESTIALLALFTLISLGAYIIAGNVTLSIVVFILLVMATVAFNRVAGFLLSRRERILSVRRLDATSLVEAFTITGAFLVSLLIYRIVGWVDAALAVFISGVALSTYIGFSVKRSMTSTFLAGFIPSMSSFFMSIPVSFVYTSAWLKAVYAGLHGFLAGISMMELTRLVIDRMYKVRGVKPFMLFKAFVKSLLEGMDDELENTLLKLSKQGSATVDIVLFKPLNEDYGKPVALVIPDIHMGPFRTVGSSALSSIIQAKLAEAGVDAAVLKGLSGHESNIATKREAVRLAEEIKAETLSMLSNSEFTKVINSPSRITLDTVSSIVFELNGKKLAVVTLNPSPMEDIPKEALPEEAGQNKLIVVDSHNSYHEGFTHLSGDTLRRIRALLKEVNDSNSCSSGRGSFRIGFSRIVPGSFGLAEGMGPGGVSCLVVEAGGGMYALLIIDANNAVPWVRDVALDTAAKYGIVDAEVCTTDTHVVNGIKLGGKGYNAFGEVIPEEDIRRIFDELFRRAIDGMYVAEVAYSQIQVNNINMFAEILDEIAISISKGSRILTTTLLATPLIVAFTLLL